MSVAWLLRVRRWLKAKTTNAQLPNMKESVTVDELEYSELQIVKYVQQKAFHEELANIKLSNDTTPQAEQVRCAKLNKGSCIYRLEPVMFSDNVLRVGGRLKSHPAILPKNHCIVKLIVRHYHTVCGHSGKEYVMSLIRQNYWIIGVRTVIRQVLKECSRCRLSNPKPQGQRMANLPADRISAMMHHSPIQA